MEHQIFIREAVTESEIARFFGELHTYHRRDIFPETEQAEDLAYFLSDEYLSQLKTLHRRQENRLHFLFFERFWGRLGFLPNGCDEWGEKLMLRPPEEDTHGRNV